MAKHLNNGNCPHCAEIFNKYPNFNLKVKSWFTLFQAAHPEAHISCAGRGFVDQEAAKAAKTSRADFGHSAHNYNCAIDIFVQLPHRDLYDHVWFSTVLAPEIPYFLNWYGAPDAQFHELPHIELREWRGQKIAGDVSLVEPIPGSVA